MEYIHSAKDKKKSISQIIIECIEKIFELSTKEFTGGFFKTIITGNVSHKEYVPSPASCYCQSIRNLSYILTPFFDKDMTTKYTEIMGNIKTAKKEKDSKIKREKELELTEELFVELNLLLKRKDYLKGESYSDILKEEDLEDEEDEEDLGDEK